MSFQGDEYSLNQYTKYRHRKPSLDESVGARTTSELVHDCAHVDEHFSLKFDDAAVDSLREKFETAMYLCIRTVPIVAGLFESSSCISVTIASIRLLLMIGCLISMLHPIHIR